MKTIIVQFVNAGATLSEDAKKYAYVTSADVKEGDILKSPNYGNSTIHVIKVVNKEYKYHDKISGKLKNTYDSTSLVEIGQINIVSKDARRIIEASIV